MRGRLEKVLARRLREVAAQRRLPLSHVADRAGVPRSYFWLLLDGSSSATLDAIQRLADTLDVEPLALLTATAASSVAPIAAEPGKTKTKAKRVMRTPSPTKRKRRVRTKAIRRA